MMAELDILNSFAGKVISDCIDIAIDKIKKADKNRKSKNQTMETRIYQVTIDALNEFPYNKYKKEEKVYDAAESILKELKKGNRDYQEAVKLGLRMLVSQVTDDICKDFLKTLCYEICKDENDVLYKEIALIQQEQLNENVNEGFKDNNRSHEETHKKLDEIQEDINGLKERQGMTRNYEPENANRMPIINRAEEYAKKWNKNVFLNNFNVEDQNAGVNIKLKDIYLEEHLPHYIWKTNTKPSDKLKNLLKKYIIDNNERKMLLILGQPGIGKSTLITWVMANLVEKKEQVLVYQFASDLKKINWQGEDILEEIFKALRLGDEELESKVFILDGFDEIRISGDRERILNKLNQELKKMNHLDNFSLIITCRENYVAQSNLENIDYITLQTWDEDQIKSFCEIYGKENTKEESEIVNNKTSEIKINKIIEKKEIFGIPLILYMVLALDVAIEKSSSIVDIYDQIFLSNGGSIYDRCYDVEHRINKPEIREYIHRISQKIAFWMFENNADEATIPQEKFKEICENEMSESGKKDEDIQSNTLIGNFFKLKHCEGEGTDNLQFIHRSIYEYFVVVYFYESMYRLISKEAVAGKLGELLKGGRLSEQILEFVKYKFDKMRKYNLADITRGVFDIMLKDGMTYHIGVPCMNAIEREGNIFSNMLEVVGLWNPSLKKFNRRIIIYLQYNRENDLNLIEANLIKANLIGANLIGANLIRANLIGSNLSGSNLSRANLIEADLSEVYLKGANLIGSNLSRADLSRADLSRADLSGSNLSGSNLIEADLSGTYLNEVDLRKADLRKADLRRADLSGSNLIGADLRKADLIGADLSGTYLRKADLRKVNLIGADLSGSSLVGADLSGADLSGANLSEAYLSGSNLRETIFNEKQVSILYERYDLSKSMVYLSDTNEIISYKEYCFREQRT